MDDTPLTDDRYISAMTHLVRLIMKYQGLSNLDARRLALEMVQEGPEWREPVTAPSTNGTAAADAFMGIFGFKRVDEVPSVRKTQPLE